MPSKLVCFAWIYATCILGWNSFADEMRNGSEIEPIVIAHRGASGEIPEHTLEAYARAIEQGADFIEPDLVMTKDGVLVARHDPWLSDSTNISELPQFADRKTTIVDPEGSEISDWFVWDFTLAELQMLRARQVRDGRSKAFDDKLVIPTFREILDLVGASNIATGSGTGVYPETKWPGHHTNRGLDMVNPLLAEIAQAKILYGELPIFIQSFEPNILIDLNKRTDLPLIQLVFPLGWQFGHAPSVSLEELSEYADGVGPYKALLIDPLTGQDTGYTMRARALGLDVHPWTYRDDDLPDDITSSTEELQPYLDLGITGFFTDFPATGRAIVDSRKNLQ